MSGPKVVHKPTFPSRHLKPPIPKAPPGVVEPLRLGKARAHPVGDRMGTALSWGILILCMVLGVFFWERIRDAAGWVHMSVADRGYAQLGADLCRQPLLTVPEYQCESCFSTEQELLIQRYEAQARGANEWRAERCLPLL